MKISMEDLKNAFNKVSPSISTKDKHIYEDVSLDRRVKSNPVFSCKRISGSQSIY